ncbi:MAG: asparagine--tRNA ligase, partial [Gemmatimonadetes bacterium]|nr:asparagine--tRNA ligase [Gemmatimonadota bacterium]
MQRTDIRDLARHVGQSVTVMGWVTTTRASGKILFVVVRDGSGYLQVVVSKRDVSEAAWNIGQQLTQETSLAVTG